MNIPEFLKLKVNLFKDFPNDRGQRLVSDMRYDFSWNRPGQDSLKIYHQIQEGGESQAGRVKVRSTQRPRLQPRRFTQYAVGLDEFTPEVVGGKSFQQLRMRGRLPDWIRLPASAAVPFGVFEHVLGAEVNGAPARNYAKLLKELAGLGCAGGAGEPALEELLGKIRAAVLELSAPPELQLALEAALRRGGLDSVADRAKAWHRIKQVWASKWNMRAYLSRTHLRLAHQDLFMAVLIQQVVPADYAFVIHTVNPISGSRDELFAEVVLGLGETLVGNFPGRALSFVYQKASGETKLLSLPGKSVGLYGGGLIFRSDSNGEDLEGYADAGLYDSVLLDAPREAVLDYAEERLVCDTGFQSELLEAIGQIGLAVEQAYGAPQDIEGAVTQDQYYVVQARPQVGLAG